MLYVCTPICALFRRALLAVAYHRHGVMSAIHTANMPYNARVCDGTVIVNRHDPNAQPDSGLACAMLSAPLTAFHAFVTHPGHTLGLSFVLCVAVIWVAASFVVQDLVSAGLDPFLLTYIANSLFVVLLPASGIAAARQRPFGE